jgi:voltage-gated potassium channel Kch
MSIDVGLILSSPLRVAALALAVVAIKLAVLLLLARLFRLSREDSWIFALSISQVGEFAFVLIGPAAASGVLEPRLGALANAVVAVSMLSTPLLFLAFERWVRPHLSPGRKRSADPIDERNPVIVAGVGRFGQIVARTLMGRGCSVTIIDHDPNQVDLLRRFGFRAHYGDASRPDVLEAAGVASTRLLVLAMDDPAAVLATARHVRERYPDVQMVARVHGRLDAIDLVREGVPVVRETFGASLQAAQAALVALGEHPYQARLAVERFRRHDEALLREQAALEADNDARYVALANEGRERLAALLAREQRPGTGGDEGANW